MKNIISIIMVLVLLLALAACGEEGINSGIDQDSHIADSSGDSIQPSINTEPEDDFSEKPVTGKKIAKITFSEQEGDHSYRMICEMEYGEDGLSRIKQYENGILDMVDTFYGSIQYQTARIYYEEDGAEKVKASYSYDEAGNLVESLEYGTTYLYTYDDAGNKTSMTACYEGETRYTYYYEYDKKGSLVAQRKCNSEGNVLNSYVFSCVYDANDRLIAQTNYEDGELISEYTFKYDENGNILEQTYDSYYYVEFTETCTYQYNENGDLTDYVRTENGEKTESRKLKYNERGQLDEEVRFWDGYEERLMYEYADEGYLVQYMYSVGEEVITCTIEYGDATETEANADQWRQYLDYVETWL